MSTTNNFQQESDSNSMPLASNNRSERIIKAFQAITTQKDLAAKDYFYTYQKLDLELKEGQEIYLYGMVIEIGKPQGGYDLLTVYTNYCTDYIDYTGKAILWDRPDGNFDALIDDVLEAGKILLPNMPLWDDDYFQPVAKDYMRIHLLSSQGMYSAEATLSEMATSPLGEEIVQASDMLIRWLLNC